MTINVTTEGVKEVNDLINTLPLWAYAGVRRELSRYVLDVDTEAKQRATTNLNTRTGNLKKSFGFAVNGDSLDTLSASNWNTAIYAPVQEFGAEGKNAIRAKNKYLGVPGGPYLNIPTSMNQTLAAVQRLSARDVFASGGYIVATKARRARYMVMLKGVPMFWLVKSVEIPPRLGFIDAATRRIPELLSDMAKAAMEEGRKLP